MMIRSAIASLTLVAGTAGAAIGAAPDNAAPLQPEPEIITEQAVSADEVVIARIVERSSVDGQQPEAREIEIRYTGGAKPSVKFNGRELPQDRVVIEDGQIILLDEQGKVMWQQASPRGAMGILRERTGGIATIEPFAPAVAPNRLVTGFAVAPETPKFVIGVTISEASDAVLEHLGVEQAVRIDSVNPDMPASRAGMQPGDLVVEINGVGDIGIDALRANLDAHKGEGPMTFKVIRKGSPVTLRVIPQRSAPSAPATPSGPATPGIIAEDFEFTMGGPDMTRLRGMLEQLQASMANDAMPRNLNAEARTKMNMLREQVAAMTAELDARREAIRGLGGGSGTQDLVLRFAPGGGGELTLLPEGMYRLDPDGAGRGLQLRPYIGPKTRTDEGVSVFQNSPRRAPSDLESRLGALEDRLDRIEKLLERIADR